jgi:hippurate hydrolase
MKRLLTCTPLLSLLFFPAAPTADAQPKTADAKARLKAISKLVAEDYPRMDALYKHFHKNPELSLQEEKTAARLAKELKDAGFEVTEGVGGHGVVAVLKNGKGPTVLVRADMDALPIVERTGLPYASKVRTRGPTGEEVGVMHACGHDVNMTCLTGTARVLVALKEKWHGTLVFVGQPAEEIGAGARMMVKDGLFKRFPKPDYCLALHCDARYPYGVVNFRDGQMQANVDSVDVTVRGKGGHGAAPHTTIDPVVIAARIVLDLQTIVSRERNPTDPVVVTVGSIHGGTKHNVIPDDVKLQITVRTTNDKTRKQVLEGIERLVKAAAQGAGAPEPTVSVDPGQFTPSLSNDSGLVRKLVPVLRETVGADNVQERPMSMGGEDFSVFVREGVPGFYYHLGSAPPEAVAEARREGGKPLPTTHSDLYYPVPEPTIKTGVVTMSTLVLHLLGADE